MTNIFYGEILIIKKKLNHRVRDLKFTKLLSFIFCKRHFLEDKDVCDHVLIKQECVDKI